MHIILNMVTLYYIGAQVEAIYGHWRYLGIYLLSGIAGNIASFAFGTPTVSQRVLVQRFWFVRRICYFRTPF